MSLLRKLLLGLALVALLAVAVIFGWRLYRAWTRPDIARDGGTVLVYEVDSARWPDGKAPPDYDPQQLAVQLKQRLDPADLYDVTVRPVGDNRVEISLPRRGGISAEQVAQVKELIAGAGVLEFRILANTDDDKEVIEAAQRYYDAVNSNPAELEKLRAAEAGGAPSIPPAPPHREGFHVQPNNEDMTVTYSWVELGPAERNTNGLANDQQTEDFWKEMEAARKEHKAVWHTRGGGEYRTNLFYSREVTNPERLPEKDRGKRYEYFILCRDPARDEEGRPKALTGDNLLRADPTEEPNRHEPAVGLTFNSRGAARLYELTAQNKGRQLAIVLDGMIQSAPTIQSPISGGKGVITGQFTREDVDRLVTILRSGALPATLKPVPVSEITVEPRK